MVNYIFAEFLNNIISWLFGLVVFLIKSLFMETCRFAFLSYIHRLASQLPHLSLSVFTKSSPIVHFTALKSKPWEL